MLYPIQDLEEPANYNYLSISFLIQSSPSIFDILHGALDVSRSSVPRRIPTCRNNSKCQLSVPRFRVGDLTAD
jgi:hypothetical protein